MSRIPLAVLGCALIAGCATQKAYEGPSRSARDLAVIQGSPRFNAGLPLVPSIRKVDDVVVHVGYSQVTVVPGTHRLLVDCVMSETHSTTRHELNVEVYSGRRYVLVAESGPGNRRCGSVHLEER